MFVTIIQQRDGTFFLFPTYKLETHHCLSSCSCWGCSLSMCSSSRTERKAELNFQWSCCWWWSRLLCRCCCCHKGLKDKPGVTSGREWASRMRSLLLFRIRTWDGGRVLCRWSYIKLDFREDLNLDFQTEGCVDLDVHWGPPVNQSVFWRGHSINVSLITRKPNNIHRWNWQLFLHTWLPDW